VRDGCQRGSIVLMPRHKMPALLQQLQHHRAIPEFEDLQRRPFLRPGERISNIRKCQARQALTASCNCPISVVSCWRRCASCKSVASSRARQRAAPSSIGRARQGPRAAWATQHLWSVRRDSPMPHGKSLTLKSTNFNRQRQRRKAQVADLAPILLCARFRWQRNFCDPARGYRFGMA
jgi:hypothetical protein